MSRIKTIRNRPKPFSWSYSKLKNFRACPKKHYHVDVLKDFQEPESDELRWGNTVHKVLAQRVGQGTVLPPVHEPMLEPWAQRIMSREWDDLMVENQLAIREDLSPCEWFADDAWYRGIADLIAIEGSAALVWDYKTGKVKEDETQLALMAQCVFSHRPDVKAIRTEFIWLKEDARSRADFTRADMPELWNRLLPELRVLKDAYATTSFPAEPGGLCRRWCPVKSCPHHGGD
jgi:hypothetical protein